MCNWTRVVLSSSNGTICAHGADAFCPTREGSGISVRRNSLIMRNKTPRFHRAPQFISSTSPAPTRGTRTANRHGAWIIAFQLLNAVHRIPTGRGPTWSNFRSSRRRQVDSSRCAPYVEFPKSSKP